MAKHKGKKAAGGEVSEKEGHENEYNAKGSPEMREAHDEKDEFKRGGHKKKASGGAVLGTKAAVRLDRRARGGRTGHSPFTEAKASKEPPGKLTGTGSGHEDEQPHDMD